MIRHIDEAFGLQDADVDEWSLIAEGTTADRGRVEGVDPLAVTGWIEAHAIAAARGHAAGTATIAGEKITVRGDVVVHGPFFAFEVIPRAVAAGEVNVGEPEDGAPRGLEIVPDFFAVGAEELVALDLHVHRAFVEEAGGSAVGADGPRPVVKMPRALVAEKNLKWVGG